MLMIELTRILAFLIFSLVLFFFSLTFMHAFVRTLTRARARTAHSRVELDRHECHQLDSASEDLVRRSTASEIDIFALTTRSSQLFCFF